MPPRLALRTRWRTIALYAGGTLANLLLAAFTLVFLAFHERYPLGGLATAVAFTSIFFAVISIWPSYRAKAARSDGAHIVELLRSRATFTGFDVALGQALAQYQCGTWFQSADKRTVAELEGDCQQGSKGLLRDVLLFELHFFAGDRGKARLFLDRALSEQPESQVAADAVLVADAFFSAYVEHDVRRAESAIARVVDSDSDNEGYWRAKAAIAIARGDRAGALEHLRQVRFPIMKSNPFVRPFQKEFLKVMKGAARALPANGVAASVPA
jgi:hypothetical protein